MHYLNFPTFKFLQTMMIDYYQKFLATRIAFAMIWNQSELRAINLFAMEEIA
jgi:hypothetical protein